ncbi:VapB-type antitoxin [Halovenus sp. WSH3]|uniref:VapB-type antitoxin n=1 Tax=Halovenus carboxidivorans TaxID=2692199 RepID=A0A6B0T421_9EURY|nr:VapB-type antitoxin [Halovenus carboxidivorans]MXR53038.1 VapB-type antitoxin [Halovenus carboxidivorans]
MATVSLRVPDELKEKMDDHPEINWSAVIRANIEEEIEQLESRSVAHAVATSERLSSGIDEAEVKDRNTAETIREWRDKRHGADSD